MRELTFSSDGTTLALATPSWVTSPQPAGSLRGALGPVHKERQDTQRKTQLCHSSRQAATQVEKGASSLGSLAHN
eukprot:4399104-Pleurochrysis_carterae.AAC.3